MSTLERALEIAARAHAGDTDKAGAPYIEHPIRVMQACDSVEARIAAVLHDVVEDSDWTLEGLREDGFSENVVAAVDAVSRREGEDYLEYVARARQDRLGREIKRADLLDNLETTRISEPKPEDYQRMIRYVRALAVLDGVGVEEARGW